MSKANKQAGLEALIGTGYAFRIYKNDGIGGLALCFACYMKRPTTGAVC